MEKIELTLSFDSEKMEALAFYLEKENADVRSRMDEALRLLYEQTAPEPVREYLDARTPPAARPKRPPRPNKPRREGSPKPPASTEKGEEETI